MVRIGIDLGGSHIGIGLVNDKNKIIIEKEYNWTEDEKKDYNNSVVFYIEKLIKELLEESKENKIEKIGIGYPSKDIVNGIVYINNKPFDLCSILKEKFDVPVYLKNDVKCSATCEKEIGNLKEYNNCIFMTLGTGIGGAYFYQNKLVKPNEYQGFEIGHMVIQANGKQCRCGRKGCFEEYASMRAFRNKIKNLFNISKVRSEMMFEIIEKKEKQEEVEKIINEYIEYLSIGISNLISIFEPDAICIGGSFAYYDKIFMKRLKAEVQKRFVGRRIPQLLVAKYGNDAGIIGASMLESN